MHIPFLFIFEFYKKRKFAFWLSVFIIAVVALFGVSRIKFIENIEHLIPHEKQFSITNHLFSENKISRRVIIVLQENGSESNFSSLSSQADSLVESLYGKDSLFNEITYKVQPFLGDSLYDFFYRNMPYFMTDEDYDYLEKSIDSINQILKSNFNLTYLPVNSSIISKAYADPFHIVPRLLQRCKANTVDAGINMRDDYLTLDSGRSIVIMAYPRKSESQGKVNQDCLDRLLKIKSQIQKSNYDIFFFGTPLVEAINAKVIKRDIMITSTLALIALLVFIWSYFKSPLYFFRIVLPVSFGGLIALSCIGYFQGSISSLALGLGAVLLGLGVNISLHFFTHFINHPDPRQLIIELAPASLLTALTTSSAFFCLCFLKSPVLQDIGLFSGLSILFITLSNLVIVPHLLPTSHNKPEKNHWIDKLASIHFHKNKILIVSLFILFSVCVLCFKQVRFEGDMTKMSYVPSYLKESEDTLEAKMQYKLKMVYSIMEAKTLNELSVKSENTNAEIEKLKNDGVISNFQNGFYLLPSGIKQKKCKEKWDKFWTNDKVNFLQQSMHSHSQIFGYDYKVYNEFLNLIKSEFGGMSKSDQSFVINHFAKDLIEYSDSIIQSVGIIKVKEQNRKLLYQKLKSNKEVELFDKNMLTERFVNLIKSDLNFLLFISFFLVTILILISFGRIELTFLSVIPMMIGWIITLGLMSLFNIPFTIFNIILATFIFGMGDDFSVFLISGLQSKYAHGIDQVRSYRSSVLLACITTLCGIGVLVFATHPALKSIGLVAVVGIFSVVLSSFVIQPILFDFFIGNRKNKGQLPITFFGFIISIIAFLYFFIGCIILTIVGIFLILLIPLNFTRKLYHYCIHYYCKSLIYLMFTVKKKWIFESQEVFEKPSIIIANHSSFVDILVMLSLHPRIIMLANDWVFNKSAYGFLVRMAGFYHVKNGYENAVPYLRKFIDQGYSIMVFPEGTRSIDGEMKRFHKGSFYLAEKLNLDITPVFIHGLHLAMPKGDYLLKPSICTIRVAPNIKFEDTQFGEGYSERTLKISRWMKSEFSSMRESIETPDFFANLTIQNYVLKGPVLEWYVRVKLWMESNFSVYHKLIPKGAKVVDIGCGYGYMSLILALADKTKSIVGIDFDSEKISIACNLNSAPERLQFVCSNMTSFEYSMSDAFILGDVLHYLSATEQEAFLLKIIECCNEGARILIRESDKDLLKYRHDKSVSTEVISTAIGFNKYDFEKMSFVSGKTLKTFFESNGFTFEKVVESKKNSNTLFMAVKEQK